VASVREPKKARQEARPDQLPPIYEHADQCCSAWSVYRQAIDGWGATLRLCLILAIRWGVPVSGGVRIVILLLSHVH